MSDPLSSSAKDVRHKALSAWGQQQLVALSVPVSEGFSISATSDDASFRRYFRGEADGRSFIFVDAPPDKEDNASFLLVQGILQNGGVRVPLVLASDIQQGFLLLEDFGDTLFLERVLSPSSNAESLYQQALGVLSGIQNAANRAAPDRLPVYD
ncbi:MAG: aminoglycoside phosphotransferase, partial [Pseudomonadales bacterium]|nr:aminoglycoside phosphotransferase [Pseudomonadales bacterium]